MTDFENNLCTLLTTIGLALCIVSVKLDSIPLAILGFAILYVA